MSNPQGKWVRTHRREVSHPDNPNVSFMTRVKEHIKETETGHAVYWMTIEVYNYDTQQWYPAFEFDQEQVQQMATQHQSETEAFQQLVEGFNQ